MERHPQHRNNRMGIPRLVAGLVYGPCLSYRRKLRQLHRMDIPRLVVGLV